MIRKAMSLLDEHRVEATPARVRILSTVMGADIPLEVTDVAAHVGDAAHLATIYRTLEMYVKVGLLERVNFQEGKFRYEYVSRHHHHAVCEQCGKIEDVEDEGIEQIESRIKKDSGFMVRKHVIELFGICNKCQQKGKHE